MSTLRVRCLDATRCVATHTPSGTELTTDVTPQYGGGGTSFSSTDLVAVALATCIGSSLAPVLLREGVALDDVAISVDKMLLSEPRRIGRLAVSVELPASVDAKQYRKLSNAARTCAVHRTLGDRVEIDVRLTVAER